MPKIVHFELPFDDAERANRFYAEVFGWESHKWEGPHEYYLQETGPQEEPGIGGALAPRERMATDGGAHIVIGVDDLDAYLAKVTAAGCDIVTPPHRHPRRGLVRRLPRHGGQRDGHVPEGPRCGVAGVITSLRALAPYQSGKPDESGL